MSYEREPAPIERRTRRKPVVSHHADGLLVPSNVYSSLAAGPAIMAAISSASTLQHFLPDARWHGFPVAGLLGLSFGWMLVLPVARFVAARINAASFGAVILVAVATGLLWATPAAFYGSAIGWLGGAVRLYVVAGVLSASGLVWGGYLNADARLV